MTERIGRFEILGELGSGGMGVVHRARDPHLGREVALKVIRPDRGGDAGARARFLREVRAEAALSHPGIATLYEAGETADGQLYFVAELVEGESLADRLARGPLPTADVLRLGLELAEALGAAHRRGVVHRDVKPENLRLTSDGRLKVLDFGLARLDAPAAAPIGDSRTETALTALHRIVGTPAYMSPEQASGGAVDARSDVFSAGTVLYEMATGRRAFEGADVSETLRFVISRVPAAPETVRRDVPAALASVIRRAMPKEPAERYADGDALAAALRAAAEVPSGRPRVPRRAGLAVAGALVVAAIAAAVWWTGSPPALAFRDRDRMLVADVENHTDEDVFGLALRTALEADLAQSPYALVLGRSELADILRRMKLDPSTTVDVELGRDVCRFAGIKALVVPRILAAGDAFELQAALVDPGTGRQVETVRASAEGREAVLLGAVDALTSQLRSRLGESLESIRDTDLPLAGHTTTSWEALRSLTLADRHWQAGDFEAAERLFRSALEFDPDFSAARGSLGLLLVQFLHRPDEGKRLLTEALEGADDVTDLERRMLRAVHHQFVEEDFEAALGEYEAILDLYPDAFQAANNRGRILMTLGRFDAAIAAFEHAAELLPAASVPLWNLVFVRWLADDPDGAVEAARTLVARFPDSAEPLALLGWSYAGAGRLRDAEDALRRCLAIEPTHFYSLANLGHVLMALERPDEAGAAYARWAETYPDPHSTVWVAFALRSAGRHDAARDTADRALASEPGPDPSAVPLLEALAGRAERAGTLLGGLAPDGFQDFLWVADARAVLGDRDGVIDAVDRAIRAGYNDWFMLRIRPTLAGVWDDPRFVRLATWNGSGDTPPGPPAKDAPPES